MPLGLRFCCLLAGVAADGLDRVNVDHRGRKQFASTRDMPARFLLASRP